MSIDCQVAGVCGGCAWIGRPYHGQIASKRDALRASWREAGLPGRAVKDLAIHTAGEAGLRDRTDLAHRRTPDGSVLGLWDLDRARVVDVGACPAVSPPLRALLADLHADPAPVDRASIRLRVAPDGARGLWIDAANADIKTLLDHGAWLRRRLKDTFVELGQRRKPVADDGARLRLGKRAELRPWFRTWIGETPAPLYLPVGGFSQPSLAANRLLVDRAMALADRTGAASWLELGAGNGNFTLPLAGRGAHVTAVESDRDARDGLARSAGELGVVDRVRANATNMHAPTAVAGDLAAGAEALFADPPRSGLGRFVDALAAAPRRPAHIVYVSCHGDTLVADLARLVELGYEPRAVEAVDQFPQSPHGEWLALLSR